MRKIKLCTKCGKGAQPFWDGSHWNIVCQSCGDYVGPFCRLNLALRVWNKRVNTFIYERIESLRCKNCKSNTNRKKVNYGETFYEQILFVPKCFNVGIIEGEVLYCKNFVQNIDVDKLIDMIKK